MPNTNSHITPNVDTKVEALNELSQKLGGANSAGNITEAIQNITKVAGPGGGGGGSSTIEDLLDVSVNDPVHGQTLVYSNITGDWENGTPGGVAKSDVVAPAFDTAGHMSPPVYQSGDVVDTGESDFPTWYRCTYDLGPVEPGTPMDPEAWAVITPTRVGIGTAVDPYGYYVMPDDDWTLYQNKTADTIYPNSGWNPGTLITYTRYGQGTTEYTQYDPGDYVMMDGDLYECVSTTEGPYFDPEAWVLTSVMYELEESKVPTVEVNDYDGIAVEIVIGQDGYKIPQISGSDPDSGEGFAAESLVFIYSGGSHTLRQIVLRGANGNDITINIPGGS